MSMTSEHRYAPRHAAQDPAPRPADTEVTERLYVIETAELLPALGIAPGQDVQLSVVSGRLTVQVKTVKGSL